MTAVLFFYKRKTLEPIAVEPMAVGHMAVAP